MKKIIVVIIAILGISFIWYFFYNSNSSPSITLLSPQGGESIETGSKFTIRWTSQNMPENYKIAINLYRAISVNELIEGQEFDPILFIDLENTGEINWEILDQYPEGDYFINIVAYESLPITEKIINSKNKNTFHLSPPQLWLTYNSESIYSLDYPNYLKIKKFSDLATGADFYLFDEDDATCITIATRDSVNRNNLSFEEYVKIAAKEEIQGFEEINSIEKLLTNKGIVGYKTTWIYQNLAQGKQTSLPITYFPGIDPNHTVQINLNRPECAAIYEKMILTFAQ